MTAETILIIVMIFIFACVFVFAGLALIRDAIRMNRKLASTTACDGVVIGYEKYREERPNNGYHVSYLPVVRYRVNGCAHTNMLRFGYGEKLHTIGSHVKVFSRSSGAIIEKSEIRTKVFLGIFLFLVGASVAVFLIWLVLNELI